MHHVQVVGSVDPAMLEIRMGRLVSTMPSSNADHEVHPDPFDLVLAGLGGSTANSMIDYAVGNGWDVHTVYVELALHGETPWQAIGRRIWVDGDLEPLQLAALLEIAEHSPVATALRSVVELQSKIDRLPSTGPLAEDLPQLWSSAEWP